MELRPLDPQDKDMRALCDALNAAHFNEVIHGLCDMYERTEHELALGLEVSPEDRAQYERIKAKVEAGSSLRDVMTK
jgi:hypothetical protein